MRFSSKPHKANDPRWMAIREAQARGPIQFENFKLLRELGKGATGIVYLAELKNSNATRFAIKAIDVRSLGSARNEISILSALDHPFLPTIYAEFRTGNQECMVMDYCSGGNLGELRMRQPRKRFDETAVKFYSAEILLALEYLHMQGIVSRDLKPSNVLVQKDGHVMLSDFDISVMCHGSSPTVRPHHFILRPASKRWFSRKTKKLATRAPELVHEPKLKSDCFVGTCEYMAPEIAAEEIHGASVDWWSFGIFIYELLYGKTPFRGKDGTMTLINITEDKLQFPVDGCVSEAAKSLITRLLSKEPCKRLGFSRGACEIKEHPFFADINWALLRNTTPPNVSRVDPE